MTTATRPRLKVRYDEQIRQALKDELGFDNIMQVPRLEKIVLNSGVGRATQQASLLEGAQRDLEQITGQKPVVTRAKKSIASFKLREEQPIGVKVTLIAPGSSSTVCSASPSRESATSVGCRRSPSTGTATTPSE
jgi:large subunit ribosomal protein L5